MAQINKDSFLIFADNDGFEYLPRPFDWHNGDVSPEVVLVPGESYSLYIKGVVSAISSITNGDNSYSVTSAATAVTGLAFTHTLLTFSIDNSVPDGTYVFKAGSYTSQEVSVLRLDDAKIDTALVEFSNLLNLADFFYPYAPSFSNKVRIRINTLGTQPFGEQTVYDTSADGNGVHSKKWSLWGRRELFTMFQTVDYRDFAHAACDLMTRHRFIKINNIEYFLREDNMYTVEGNGTSMSNGQFGLTRNDSTFIIRA